jgi:hypothetical protein
LTFYPERSGREGSQKLSEQNQQNARVSKNLPFEISNHELNTLDLTIDWRKKTSIRTESWTPKLTSNLLKLSRIFRLQARTPLFI